MGCLYFTRLNTGVTIGSNVKSIVCDANNNVTSARNFQNMSGLIVNNI
jgi:hypothetical protein